MRRFINADILHGAISDSTSLNRYSYVNGNPVSFVDSFGFNKEDRGNGPTPLEAAYMADHIYGAELMYDENGIRIPILVEGWELVDIKINTEGLKMGLYSKSLNGVTEYVVVNAGSEGFIDWINNFQQPYGVSTDMKDSINYATNWVKKYEGANFAFVGHSKGGGEAIANAVATGYNAITFNPATPRLSKYGLSMDGYNGNITNYIVEGEMLNTVLAGLADSAVPLIATGIVGMVYSVVTPKLTLPKKQKLFNTSLATVLLAEGFFLDPVGSVHYLPYEGNANAKERHFMDCVISEIIEEIDNL